MDSAGKLKIGKLKSQNGINETFLKTQVVPRYIVFVDEKKNLIKLT